ncbi:MAG: hypothetical protein WC841_05740 [Candidatus Shapirobacteria bacterium]|jgi:arginase
MDNLFVYFLQAPATGNDPVVCKGAEQILNSLGDSINFQKISHQSEEQRDLIELHQPLRIFTLGCSPQFEVTPITYLNQKYNQDFLVIWFDIRGYPFFTDPAFSQLDLNQIILAGVNDLGQSITTTSCHELKNGQLIYKILKKAKKNIYIHLNLNVLDPQELGSASRPDENGIPFEALISQIFQVKKDFNIVGISIVEAPTMTQYQLDKVNKLVLKTFE